MDLTQNVTMKYKLIGLYELVTGLFGVLLILINSGKAFATVELFFSFVLGLGLYAYVALAGYQLLNHRKQGVLHSIVAQAIQILKLFVPGFMWVFTGSAFIELAFNNTGIHLYSQLAPIDYKLIVNPLLTTFEVGVFLVPAILVVILAIDKITKQ
jgi:hypothetical protein